MHLILLNTDIKLTRQQWVHEGTEKSVKVIPKKSIL